MSGPTNEKAILGYIHCGACVAEIQKIVEETGSASPRDYQQIEAGWTKEGLQIWCRRHACNILHIDFQGHKHPANTTRRANA